MFVEKMLKIQTNIDYICYILDKADECNAGILYQTSEVLLYQNCIDRFNNYNAFDFFSTLFHESIHAVQFHLWNSNKISFESLFQIKDYLLKNIIPNYYQDNYKFIFYEVEAYLNEGDITLNYMQCFKYQITKDMIEKKETPEKIFNKIISNISIRKVNGEYDDLFNLFDKHIKDNPKWLKKFPMLNVEYIVEDNK